MAATTATASVTAAAAATSVAGHLGKAGIDLLLGLLEHVDEIASLLRICAISVRDCVYIPQVILTLCGEQGDRSSLGARTTSTANAMNVVFRVVRIVIVQHMGDVADVWKSQYAESIWKKSWWRGGDLCSEIA